MNIHQKKEINIRVGETPLQKIKSSSAYYDVYVKREDKNKLSHSVKDRAAWEIIRRDLDRITSKNLTVIDSSSGNFAISLATLGKKLHFSFHLIADPKHLRNKKIVRKLRSLDATIEFSDRPQKRIEEIMRKNPKKYFYTNQYGNPKNTLANRATGQEILKDIEKYSLNRIDYFFGALGTSGSSQGIISAIRTKNPDLVSVGIVSARHSYIQGLRNKEELLDVALFDPNVYSYLAEISAKEALQGRKILGKQGIRCGNSTGAVYACIQKYRKLFENGKKKTVVFMCADTADLY